MPDAIPCKCPRRPVCPRPRDYEVMICICRPSLAEGRRIARVPPASRPPPPRPHPGAASADGCSHYPSPPMSSEAAAGRGGGGPSPRPVMPLSRLSLCHATATRSPHHPHPVHMPVLVGVLVPLCPVIGWVAPGSFLRLVTPRHFWNRPKAGEKNWPFFVIFLGPRLPSDPGPPLGAFGPDRAFAPSSSQGEVAAHTPPTVTSQPASLCFR